MWNLDWLRAISCSIRSLRDTANASTWGTSLGPVSFVRLAKCCIIEDTSLYHNAKFSRLMHYRL